MLLLMYEFCKKLLDDMCVLFTTLFSVADEFIVYVIVGDFVGIGESSF